MHTTGTFQPRWGATPPHLAQHLAQHRLRFASRLLFASAIASGAALIVESGTGVSKNVQKLGESSDMYSDTSVDL